jgi:hypothetical protein
MASSYPCKEADEVARASINTVSPGYIIALGKGAYMVISATGKKISSLSREHPLKRITRIEKMTRK